jgi:hypothetical protein
LTPKNFLWLSVGGVALVLGVLVGGFARTGRAQNAEPQFVTCRADFAAITITGLQQGRVRTSWVDGDGDALNVKVQFLDRRGQVLQESTQPLPPGETISSVLSLANITASQLFRTVVLVEPASGEPTFPADPGCPEVVTVLERMSATGVGNIVLSPACAIGRFCARIPASPPPFVDSPNNFPDGHIFPDASFPDSAFFPDAPVIFPDAP